MHSRRPTIPVVAVVEAVVDAVAEPVEVADDVAVSVLDVV